MPAETDPLSSESPAQSERGFRFWMVFVACIVVDALTALDLTTVSTALPTIVQDLHGSTFVWVGSAYTIGSTAVVPLIGGLVSVYGRKPILLVFIAIFAAGSALAGAAQSMNMLIAGRAIMGTGSGGCMAVVQIIYADIIPLPERGKFLGITGSVWSLLCAIGPFVGGGLADAGAWRWMFYLSLPLCGISFVLVLVFLQISAPKVGLREKVAQMDWLGLLLIVGSTLAILLALTWGGAQYAWASSHVLVPLCVGAGALVVFFVYEALWATEPTVPMSIINNRTTITGYLGAFLHGVAFMSAIYYMPVYFQGCKLASPLRSGVLFLGVGFVLPNASILAGFSSSILKVFRPQNIIGWCFCLLGFGLLSTLSADSSEGRAVGFTIVLAAGIGALWISTQFPVLAPLPVSNNARALALFQFTRNFAQSWGVVVGGAILQNVLQAQLPQALREQLPGPQAGSLAYAAIPRLAGLPEDVRNAARKAFADGTQEVWRVMLGVSGAGLISALVMREVPMRRTMDERWGLKEKPVEVELRPAGADGEEGEEKNEGIAADIVA